MNYYTEWLDITRTSQKIIPGLAMTSKAPKGEQPTGKTGLNIKKIYIKKNSSSQQTSTFPKSETANFKFFPKVQL